MEIYYNKLLAYRHLTNLNELGRYCDSPLKVVDSRNHISIQVQGCSIMMYFNFELEC